MNLRNFLKASMITAASFLPTAAAFAVTNNPISEVHTITCANNSGGTWTNHDLVLVGHSQVGLLTAINAGTSTLADAGTGATIAVEGIVEVGGSNVAINAGDPVYVTLGATAAATNVVTINKYFLGFAATESSAAASGQLVRVQVEEFTSEPRRALSSSGTTITLTAADLVGGHCTLKTTSTSAIALAIPAAASYTGCRLTVIHSAGTSAITITPASGTIAGSSTHAALDAAGDLATFVAIGTDWVLENRSIAMIQPEWYTLDELVA